MADTDVTPEEPDYEEMAIARRDPEAELDAMEDRDEP